MKNLLIALSFLCCLGTANVEAANDAVRANAEDSKKLATQTIEPQPRRSFATTLAVYPTELTLGDAAYLTLRVKNVSNATRALPGFYDDVDLRRHVNFTRISVASKDVAGTYVAAPEFNFPVGLFGASMIGGMADYAKFPPCSAERLLAETALEFPPLEDWNDPFWVAVRDKLSEQDRVVLQLRVEHRPGDEMSNVPLPPQKTIFFETTITIKRRDNKELKILERWFKETPAHTLPTRSSDGLRKGPRFHTPEDRPEYACILLKAGTFEGLDFTRFGSRKPSPTPPSAPATVDGWRELEAEFAPSTLRDEITLTRLQLEYYDADEGKASDAAHKTLVDWLSQRPEPQRVVLSQSLLSKRAKFKGTPLETKNAILCDALTSAFPVETPATDDAK